jgi:phosphatidylglycerol:prolipoprotein diacylglycerol transferase
VRIHIGIEPTFAHLGPLAMTWHGLFSALAILVAVLVIQHEITRTGYDMRRYDEIAFWTIIGGIIGARLFFLIDHPLTYLRHPLNAFKLQEGGLAIYGALIGGFFTLLLLSRIYHFRFAALADLCAPGLLLAQAVGRIGCTINGDAWGARTSSPFAFVYTNQHALLPSDLIGVPTHPYPIYDMLLTLAVYGLLRALRGRPFPPGVIFAIYAATYAIGRFCISFVREEKIWFWGLQEAQVVSLVIAVLALGALYWLTRAAGGPALDDADSAADETGTRVTAGA